MVNQRSTLTQADAITMFHPGSTQNGDDNAFARLPQDAIENILVRLSASDLRRFRRVCKEWHDIISNPIFIKAHMVEGPTAPTHTIVFVPSYVQPTSNGFLFDERWRLTARFAVGVSEVMIGTCNGLLCFHDKLQGVIKVVEPFTGETIAVPVPTYSSWTWSHDARSYCFGFDSTKRRYKIVQKGLHYNLGQGISTVEHHLNVFTIGADKAWRTISTAAYISYNNPECNGGAVYWTYEEHQDGIPMYARFDLATEEITSVACWLVNGRPIFCNHAWWQRGQPCAIRIRWLAGESDDGYWPRNMNATTFNTDDMNLPHGRRLPRPHALQRGHLLLQEANGALYAHKIMSRNIHEVEVGNEKLLIDIGIDMEEEPAKSSSCCQFVRVHGRRHPRTQQVAVGLSEGISTFAYVPTVSPAPLALYLGTPMIGAPALRVPPSEKLHNVKHD